MGEIVAQRVVYTQGCDKQAGQITIFGTRLIEDEIVTFVK